MQLFVDSMGWQHTLAYAICECYIHLVSYHPSEEFAGRCGRCNSGCKVLSPAVTKRDAEMIFYENYGRYPKALVQVPLDIA